MIKDFFSMVFPVCCQVCSVALLANEELVCTECLLDFPKANLHNNPDHPLCRSLLHRAGAVHVWVYLRFVKKGPAQKIIHRLKYKDRPDLSTAMGRWLATDLAGQGVSFRPDLVLPVPLHPRKLSARGYNQSEGFAIGLAERLGIEARTDVLVRKQHSQTQTRLSRQQRWENVSDIFDLSAPKAVESKHVMIVDDVVTTGATVEACAQLCAAAGVASVSVGAIAYTV